MVKNTLAVALLTFLVSACASSPKPEAETPKPARKTTVVKRAPESQAASGPKEVFTFGPSHKLKPGECEGEFDCVDTVGVPPPGHRWTCQKGRCVKEKLSEFGQNPSGSNQSGADQEDTKATPAKAKTKKSRAKGKKHHRRHHR